MFDETLRQSYCQTDTKGIIAVIPVERFTPKMKNFKLCRELTESEVG